MLRLECMLYMPIISLYVIKKHPISLGGYWQRTLYIINDSRPWSYYDQL